MAYHPVIDKDLCISSGKCVADHPEAFVFDADEIAEVAGGASALSDDELRAAARNCPSGALHLEDDDGADVDVW